MEVYLMPYQQIVNATYQILDQNRAEWEPRYAEYTKSFTPFKISIKLPDTLKKYTSISLETKAKQICDLRYQGQHIANLTQITGKKYIQIDPDTATSNAKCLKNCINILSTPTIGNGILWQSQDGKNIRKFFEADYGKIGHEEHTLESAFLTELSQKTSTGKSILGIQPIVFEGKRLQLATTLKASKVYNFFSPRNTKSLQQLIGYSGPKGGGIDILARRKKGNKTYLTIIELKDKYVANEKPTKSIGQAIAYATFIAMLIRSDNANGVGWYRKFGFKQNRPTKLTLYAVVAMPDIPKNIENETQNQFNMYHKLIVPNTNAEIVLHYMNLNNNAKVISTSNNF